MILLKEIAEGKVTLDFKGIDKSGFAEYHSTAGWWFRVFVGEGDWDYLDSFKRVGETEYTELNASEPFYWSPSIKQLTDQWCWDQVKAALEKWRKPS